MGRYFPYEQKRFCNVGAKMVPLSKDLGPRGPLSKLRKGEEIDHRNCVWCICEPKSKFSFHDIL